MTINNCKVDTFDYDRDSHEGSIENHIAHDKMLSIIATKTGSNNLEISRKPQIKYLFNYLASPEINAKTFVTEYSYIDKHYLDDYSKYFSRCFYPHGRECSRIHFFKEVLDESLDENLKGSFDESFFLEAIESNKEYVKKLKKSYLGYCVIRPIPENYLGRLNLKPYNKLSAKTPHHQIIIQTEAVSLFGLELEIETASMREQDQVVSACATSAIWTALNLTPNTSNYQVPSLSTITDIATGKSNPQNRTFINSGLNMKQVSTVLKYYQLEPIEKSLSSHVHTTLCRWMNAYVKQGIPILLAGDVYSENKKVGHHFICTVGFRQGNSEIVSKKLEDDEFSINFKADKIDRCYVHDDRYGQYVAIEFDRYQKFEITTNDKNESHIRDYDENFEGTKPPVIGYPVITSTEDSEKDIFLPTKFIIGLDNKIRLNYNEVERIAYSFLFHLIVAKDSDGIKGSSSTPDDFEEYIKNLLDNGELDIELISNHRIKAEIRDSKDWYDSSFGKNKSSLLIKNLPKHMWRIRIELDGKLSTDLIFDATEVFQGKILLGYIGYTENAGFLWKNIEKMVIKSNFWLMVSQQIENETKDKDLARGCICISSYLENPNNYLDKLFGNLRFPCRNLHPYELSEDVNIVSKRSNKELYTIPNKYSKYWPKLKSSTKFIWVIDEHGHLILGEDIEGDKKNGHTTLINNNPARLAGEFYYSKKDKIWVVNTMSGAYSKHINYIENAREEQKTMLEVVLTERFNNFTDTVALETLHYEGSERIRDDFCKYDKDNDEFISLSIE